MFLSKQKGNNYERKIAKILSQAWGVKLIRTPCSGAMKYFSPGDITPEDQKEYENFPFLLECKNRVGWTLEKFLSSTCDPVTWWEEEEAKQIAAQGDKFYEKCMLLIFTKNHDKSYVMFTLSSLNSKCGSPRPMFIDTENGKHIMLLSKKNTYYVYLLDDFLKILDYKETVEAYKRHNGEKNA